MLIRDVYGPAGLVATSAPVAEEESAEYGACRLSIDEKSVVFRVAKTTPTKLGQFVTIWKRPTSDGEIAPLDSSDDVDFVVISVRDFDSGRHGQFVFDRDVLVAKGVMSRDGRGGKRAMRVYGPWVQPIAKSAIKAQQWQAACFLESVNSADAEAAPSELDEFVLPIRQLFGSRTV